ncbi:hypothetical protein B296_00032190 [Ensete ventricosum]|uniref:SBP-type domain-containing protein n=1 Tax=Ensete ventricosum TaxID=4639 RepID=A0A427AEC5_ENSVE|nr:hypothetical protein B296_00032190 [Ensete ventricosum]
MEMSSSSLGASASRSSNDTLHGLMFGKKVYFEDAVGGGGGGGGGSTSKAPSAPSTAPKKGKAVVHGGGQQQPPRCQVEGCEADLTGVKAYYCRHKVCGMHSKAPKVVVGGMEQRFCQQCSRRLAGHNERRRKPPPGPFAPRYGHLAPPSRPVSVSEEPRMPAVLSLFCQLSHGGIALPEAADSQLVPQAEA